MVSNLDAWDNGGDAARVNNKARQFLARTANQIFSSRELSAVEVCASLLGYNNSYSSERAWVSIHANSAYWAVFRCWPGLRRAAGPEAAGRAGPDTIGLGGNGYNLPRLDAYAHRGPLLEGLCLYEWLSIVNVRKLGRRQNSAWMPFAAGLPGADSWVQELLRDARVPVITGYLDSVVSGTMDGYHQRSAVLLLALFVPWQDFLYREDGDAEAAWTDLSQHLPGRIASVVRNVQLLHKTAEDARRDQQLWASRSEGDEGADFDGADDEDLPGAGYTPNHSDLTETLMDAVAQLQDRSAISNGSTHLAGLSHLLSQATDGDTD
ncbi:hypothetical protein CPLU01_16050, partial [Colletotrichum plurivorum]